MTYEYGMHSLVYRGRTTISIFYTDLIFDRLVDGEAPTVKYTFNGHNYNMGHYLADGIYPNWSTFVKTIKVPTSLKVKYFATAQEAQRKIYFSNFSLDSFLFQFR
jgi:hypothetical protein